MSPQLHKELRLLLPFWVAALVVATLPAFGLANNLMEIIFILTTTLLALSLFGQEINLGTFTLMLSQPQARWKMWSCKLIVLVVAILTVWVVEGFAQSLSHESSNPEEALIGNGVILLIALAGGLWTPLFFRQVSIAFWVTLLLPAFFIFILLLSAAHPQNDPLSVSFSVIFGMACYILGGLFASLALFLRVEDVPWTGKAVSLEGQSSLRKFLSSGKSSAWFAAFKKELHLQEISFLLALVLAVLHLALPLSRLASPTLTDKYPLLLYVWATWLLVPLVVGCAAVAEERRLNTHSLWLCIPMAQRRQWAIKLFVVLLLGCLFGAVAPIVLEKIAGMIGAENRVAPQWDWLPAVLMLGLIGIALYGFTLSRKSFRALVGVLLIFPALVFIPAFINSPLAMAAFGIALLGFYASTLTRNALQALAVAVVLLCFLWGMTSYVNEHINSSPWVGPFLRLFCRTAVPALILLLGGLAYANYRRLHTGWSLWCRNIAIMGTGIMLASVSCYAIYNRSWDYLISPEPAHGPPQFHGGQRAVLNSSRPGLFALLPDGRLWASTNFFNGAGHITGHFISGGSWIGMAAGQIGLHQWNVVGVQTNGTLWNIFEVMVPPRRPGGSLFSPSFALLNQQIGHDSNWQKIVSRPTKFLALKNDGTLWEWGGNAEGEMKTALPARLEPLTKEIGLRAVPRRIGTNSDWVSIFAGNTTFIGVKRDGSLWRWGIVGVEGYPGQLGQFIPFPQPAWFDLKGTNWVSLEPLFGGAVLGTRSDGTLWEEGFVYGANEEDGIFGRLGHLQTNGRVGTHSYWNSVGQTLALKKDGTLLSLEPASPARVTRYSDWIAIDPGRYGEIALAADGTIEMWGDPEQENERQSRLLAPSRKPLKTLNIFHPASSP